MNRFLEQINKVPDPTTPLPEEFILAARPGLLRLFPNLQVEANRKDRRFEEKIFDPLETPDDIPDCVWESIKYGHEVWNIPKQARCKVQVGMYMRTSSMTLKPPEKDVLCRIILNFGYDERYLHQTVSVTKAGKTIYSTTKETVSKSNTSILLGPRVLCNHNVHIKSDPNIDLIPPGIPENIAHSKLSPNGGKTRTIRPLRYQRITVLLDFRGTDKMIEGFLQSMEKGDDNSPFASMINKLMGKGSKIKIPKSTKNLNALMESLKQQSKPTENA